MYLFSEINIKNIHPVKLIIIIVIAAITLLLVNNLYEYYKRTEYMVNISPIKRPIKWKRNKKCKYLMTKTLKNVLERNSIKETKGDDYSIYFPCTYNRINDEIKDAKPIHDDQRFFIVNNADQLTSKNAVWKNLVSAFGRENAKQIMPATYVLFDKDDIEMFKREYTPNKIYILKKNIQRQKGLKITKNKNEILKAYKKNYVIAQELLQDPYLIDGRKINMRFYLLLVCKENEISAYVHKEGFMYYTKIPFKKNSVESAPNITTGYIDRYVYEENPLTLGDFKKYLDSYDRMFSETELNMIDNNICISSTVFNRIYDMLRKVVLAVKDTTCINSHLEPYLTFQLFGADVALNHELHPQLMEINKGPDLGTKDERDGQIKHDVVTDVLKVIKAIKNTNHNFIKIIE